MYEPLKSFALSTLKQEATKVTTSPPATMWGRNTLIDDEVGLENSTERICHAEPEDEEEEEVVSRVEILGLKRWDKRLLEGFPPFLSTLDEGGRPRFDLRKARSDGRVVMIAKVRHEDFSNRPMILVRARGRQGGVVRMGKVLIDCEGED